MPSRRVMCSLILTLCGLSFGQTHGQADPLPSWKDGPAKDAIVRFVATVTVERGPDFVPVAERIAAFDNDGTLWAENPTYVQVAFTLDRIRALSVIHPDWRARPLFKAAIDGDMKSILADAPRDRLELVAASHAGTTIEEFDQIVLDWLATARHPRFNRPYTELVYQRPATGADRPPYRRGPRVGLRPRVARRPAGPCTR